MSGAASLMQMVLSLAAVVAVILGLAWMTRRMQGLRGVHDADLAVKSSLSVGIKERVVIVEARGQEFLIGVAPGRVSILKSLGPAPAAAPQRAVEAPADDAAGPMPLAGAFAIQLNKLLGR